MSTPKYEWDVRDDWTPAMVALPRSRATRPNQAMTSTGGGTRSSTASSSSRLPVRAGTPTPPRSCRANCHTHAPSGYYGIGSAIVDLHPSYPITDGTVLAARALRQDDLVVSPDDVLLAVEVEWPRSITADRIVKPYQYATAGIAHYWRVETDPFRLHAYRHVDGEYAEVGAWGMGERVSLTEPFPVEFDLASLAIASDPRRD